MKVKVCNCPQCKYVKNKRKNRKLKKTVKRLLNKRRRQNKRDICNYYWA